MISQSCKLQNFKKQTGVAALIVILILLLSISGITLYSANTEILEQKVSINDYRAKQLSVTADAGLDFGLAWLSSNNPTWVSDSSDTDFEINSTTISTSFTNGFSASLQLRRPVAAPEKVKITATATEAAGTGISATSQTEILQNKLLNAGPDAPLVINGCLSGITGNPTIHNNEGGDDIVSSQNASCIDTGHFNSSSPPAPTVEGDAFSDSAWNLTFGITQAEMQAIATAQLSLPLSQRTVHWITDSSPWNTNLGSLSPSVQPVIAIFTNCPKINGGTSIVGVTYFVGPCTTGGWGGGDIYGSIIMEGDMSGMNANTNLIYEDNYVADLLDDTTGVRARIPGSWIDQ